MHERTSRAVARLLFVFCCAVPASFTLMLILATWTPWYHDHCLSALEQKLALHTEMIFEIEDFERPTPTSLRLFGVRVLNPETGDEVAIARQVEWDEKEGWAGVLLRQPKVQSSQIQEAWTLFHEKFMRGPVDSLGEVRLIAKELTVESSTGSRTIERINAIVRPVEESVEMRVDCCLANGGQTEESFALKIVRDRSGALPLTRWELDSNKTHLPCTVVADFVPGVRLLGPEATFHGRAVWWNTRAGLSMDLGGAVFAQVDLSRMTESMPHRMTGQATLKSRHLRVVDDKLQALEGELVARKGRLDATLLPVLQEHFGFRIEPVVLASPGRDVLYDLVGLSVSLSGEVMSLEGTCRANLRDVYSDMPPGVVACFSGFPQMSVGGHSISPARVLGQLMRTGHDEMVPISSESIGLLRYLEAPSRPLRNPDNAEFAPRVLTLGPSSGGPMVREN